MADQNEGEVPRVIEPGHSDEATGWKFDNSYARLPETLFVTTSPAPASQPQVAVLNHELALQLGLDFTALQAEAQETLSGNRLPAGATPIAQAYAGHQFGGFTMLGDGRAILLGEQITPQGERFDVQLKGSGKTPFSRGGDGRAALGPMLREYIISEAMHGLGIPTTRSLAVIVSGDPVYRESPLPGAVLTRVAASHLRVGTFEYLAGRRDSETTAVLVDYTLKRHFPDAFDAANRPLALLREVLQSQAKLIAQWMLVGFVHGVMNTDNVSLAGETIDYGPCAFMDHYDPDTVFSSIDSGGRYAYGNQPTIGHWNLARFAESLLPVIDAEPDASVEQAMEVLNTYPDHYQAAWLSGMRRKLGLLSPDDEDESLIASLLDTMRDQRADYTGTFAALTRAATGEEPFSSDPALLAWHSRWQARRQRCGENPQASQAMMRSVNPIFIARNHRVEAVLKAASEEGDLAPFQRLMGVLSKPYREQPDAAEFAQPAPADAPPYRTFCGT